MAQEMDLKRLVANRDYAKGNLSRAYNFICQENQVKASSDENLLARRQRAIDCFADYEKYNRYILFLDTENADDLNLVEEKYLFVISCIDSEMNMRNYRPQTSQQPTQPVQTLSKLKLPTINIVPFDGKTCSDYITFINMFMSLIDQDPRLDSIQKLHYLRSFVKEEAYDLIKDLPLVSDSYQEALRLLDDRFYNRYKIVNEHINALTDVAPLKRANIRQFISIVNQSMASLKNLKVNVEFWDPILTNIIIRKLDAYMSREFLEELDNKTLPTVSQLLAFLGKKAIAMENAEPGPAMSNQQRPTAKVAVHATTLESPSCIYLPAAHDIAQLRDATAESSAGIAAAASSGAPVTRPA